jgi:hypothetical protein
VAIVHRKDVEVFLLGGLGNQLFGWAAGFALAKRLNVNLIVNTSQLSTRKLALPEQLLFGAKVSGEKSLYYKSNSNTLKQIYRKLPLNNSYFEKQFNFEDRFNEIKKPLSLHGYFQSKGYFENFESEIISLLDNKHNLTNEYKRIREALPDRFISIHLRRGDYVEKSEFHPLTTEKYYKKALNHLSRQSLDLKKVIFSDDESLARKMFPTDLVVTQKMLAQPFDNLYLMSQGEAIIGSNSSFSLWAGFLRSASGGVCIFPKRWFGLGSLKNLSPVPTNFVQF